LQPALPEAIDAVLARALAKSREQRYPRAREFYDALVQACDAVQDLSTAPMPLVMDSGGGDAPRVRSGSTGSGASAGTLTNATVTQELELVYWKDVRDSDDPLDLQGFLDRFPDGIYADLARRRLRRLGVVFVGEQTATRVEPRSPEPTAPGADPAVRMTGGQGDGPVAGARAAAEPAQRSKPPKTVLRIAVAGIMAVFVGAMATMWMQGGDEPAARSPAGEIASPTVAMPSAVPAAAPVPTPALDASASVPDVPAVAATPAASDAAGAAMSRSAASKVEAGKASTHAARATPPAQGGGQAAATAKPPGSVVAPVVAAGTSPASNGQVTSGAALDARQAVGPSPEKACAGRFLLGYQICLGEQCSKQSFYDHPVCEQRRAAEQARVQQQLNRN
jgi:serine/threonine-protein kinase